MRVIDMDMPKNCIECGCSDRNGCQVTNAILSYKVMRGEKPQNCPIKCDIEDIRSEIKAEMQDREDTDDFSVGKRYATRYSLGIIDKHCGRENIWKK